jgi:hypothetical protein
VETSHQRVDDVDRERDPRAPNGLPALLVNHDDVDLSVVDLDDFKRSTGGLLARRRRHGPTRFGVLSAHRLDSLVDEPQTYFDGSPSRRRPALGATTRWNGGPVGSRYSLPNISRISVSSSELRAADMKTRNLLTVPAVAAGSLARVASHFLDKAERLSSNRPASRSVPHLPATRKGSASPWVASPSFAERRATQS